MLNSFFFELHCGKTRVNVVDQERDEGVAVVCDGDPEKRSAPVRPGHRPTDAETNTKGLGGRTGSDG